VLDDPEVVYIPETFFFGRPSIQNHGEIFLMSDDLFSYALSSCVFGWKFFMGRF